MSDTVEKDVEGLAEKIIAEDEQRQKQDLVCSLDTLLVPVFSTYLFTGYFQYRS
jgi:hypothetical protein